MFCTVKKRASYVEQVDGRRLGQAALSISKGIPGFICGRIGVPKHMRASGHLAWPPHAVLKNMGIKWRKAHPLHYQDQQCIVVIIIDDQPDMIFVTSRTSSASVKKWI